LPFQDLEKLRDHSIRLVVTTRRIEPFDNNPLSPEQAIAFMLLCGSFRRMEWRPVHL